LRKAALETRLDDADTAAFLKAEAVLTPGQRERARAIAESYREKLFERRELLRGR
jgi:uridine phosphorylase